MLTFPFFLFRTLKIWNFGKVFFTFAYYLECLKITKQNRMISIKNLHASIDGKEILKGINLEVKAGEVHAIMGPNGSGKSLLIKCLHGLITPTAGRFEIGRHQGDDPVPQAMVFQKPVLLRRSVIDNLQFADQHSHQRKALD